MAERPLTQRQKTTLIMMPAVYRWTQGSLPSLLRRGLVERTHEVQGGRRVFSWHLTALGSAAREVARAEYLQRLDENAQSRA